MTLLTSQPLASVSRRCTRVLVNRVTLGYLMASSTHTTCASDFAPTRQANPSQVLHRIHRLLVGLRSSSITPTGTWNGFKPERAKSSESCWIRGSWLTAGHGYGALAGGSVGSSPRLPCT